LRNGLLKGVQLPARIHWFERAPEAAMGADR
jgi:hypothetical protein